MTTKNSKYEFIYTPRDSVSATVGAYIKDVFSRNPKLWVSMVFCDIMHAVRYPLAFFIVGLCIDTLMGVDVQDGLPKEVWLYGALLGLVLFVGELFHAVTHYITFDRMQSLMPQVRSDMMNYVL